MKPLVCFQSTPLNWLTQQTQEATTSALVCTCASFADFLLHDYISCAFTSANIILFKIKAVFDRAYSFICTVHGIQPIE